MPRLLGTVDELLGSQVTQPPVGRGRLLGSVDDLLGSAPQASGRGRFVDPIWNESRKQWQEAPPGYREAEEARNQAIARGDDTVNYPLPSLSGPGTNLWINDRRAAEMGLIHGDPEQFSEQKGRRYKLKPEFVAGLRQEEERRARVVEQSGQLPILPTVIVPLRKAGKSIAGLDARAAEKLGLIEPGIADTANRENEALEEAADRQAGGSRLKRYVRGALESVTTALLGGGLAGPAGAIGLFGGQAASEGYTEARDAGKTHGEAQSFAVKAGLIEGGIAATFQALGLGGLENIASGVGAKTLRELAKKFGGMLIKEELPEELITAAAEQVNRRLAGVNPADLRNPDGTLYSEKHGFSPLLRTFIDTVGQTAVAVGIGHAPAAGRLALNRGASPNAEAAAETKQSESDTVGLDEKGQPSGGESVTPGSERSAFQKAVQSALRTADDYQERHLGESENDEPASEADAGRTPPPPPPPTGEVRLGPKSYAIPTSMTDAVGSDGGKDAGSADLIRNMERTFGVSIRKGRIKNAKALGIFKRVWDAVRLSNQASTDVATATHEVAHHIDETTPILSGLPKDSPLRIEVGKLDYDKRARRDYEGFAEFMRTYLTYGPKEAEVKAPNFYKHFQDFVAGNPDLKAKIEKTLGDVTRWRLIGPERRIAAQISRADKPVPSADPWKSRVSEWFHRQYTNWKDAGHPISRLDKEAKRRGYKFRPDEATAAETYGAYNQSANVRAAQAIEHGVSRLSDGKVLSPGLRQMIRNAGVDDTELDRFSTYLVARQAAEVYAKKPDINPGVPQADVAAYLEAMKADPATLAKFETAAKGVTDFANATIDMLVDAGVISESSARQMKQAWELYTPLMRVTKKQAFFSGKSYVDLGGAVGRRVGSGDAIVDPLESLAKLTAYRYGRATKQRVVQRLVTLADPQLGGVKWMGHMIERVDPKRKVTTVKPHEVWPAIKDELKRLGFDLDVKTITDGQVNDLGDLFSDDLINVWRDDFSPDPDQHIFRVVINGEPRLYQVHPDLYKALKNMNPAQSNIFVEVLAGANSVMKAGATAYNTLFTGMNAVIDYMTFQFQTKNSRGLESLITPAIWTGRYLRSELSRKAGGEANDVVTLWKEMNGSLATRVGYDTTSVVRGRRSLAKPTLEGAIREAARNPVGSAKVLQGVTLEGIRDVLGFAEAGPRLAEFMGVLRKNGYKLSGNHLVDTKSGQRARPPEGVIIKAISAANVVTTDFKRLGIIERHANKLLPFLNASLEGLDKNVRTLAEGVRGENPRALIAMATMASAAAMYYLSRRDDDDYKAEANWLRFNYWTFTDERGNPIVKVRKPQGLWGMVANMTEALFAASDQGKLEPLEGLASAEAERNIPGSMPSLITPTMEAFFDYDTFRNSPIDPSWGENVLPSDRSQPYTTESMKRFVKWIAAKTGLEISPARLEHLVDKSLGGAYSRTFGTAKRIVEGKLTPRDVPFAGGFAMNRDYTDDVDQFYEKKADAMLRSGSDKLNGVRGPAADESYRLEKYADLMKALREPIRDVTDREQRLAYEKYVIGLSRHALKKEPLPRYPSPFGPDVSREVAAIRDKWLGSLAYYATAPHPQREPRESDDHWNGRIAEYREKTGRAVDLLASLGIGREHLESVLYADAKRRGNNTAKIVNGQASSFQKRLMALQKLTPAAGVR